MASATERYTNALTQKYLAQINAGRSTRSAGVDYSVLMGNSLAPIVPSTSQQENPTGLHKLIDVLSQPLYAATQTAQEVAADIYKGSQRGASLADRLQIPFAPLQAATSYFGNFGTGNQKRAWSDVLRGDVDYLNAFNQRAGINKVVTEERGPLAMSETAQERFRSNLPENIEQQNFINQLLQGVKASVTSGGEVGWKFGAGLAADILGDPLTYIGAGAISAAARTGVRAGNAALRTTETGAKVADRIAETSAGIAKTARESRLGQDYTKFQIKLGRRPNPNYARQLTENLDNEAQQAGRQIAQTETEQLVKSVSQPESIPESSVVNAARPRKILQDTVSGEQMLKSEVRERTGVATAWSRQKNPYYTAEQLDIPEPFQARTPTTAEQILKPAVPPEEIATRTNKTAAQALKRTDFLEANANVQITDGTFKGIPIAQVNRFITDDDELIKFARSLKSPEGRPLYSRDYKLNRTDLSEFKKDARRTVDAAYNNWRAEQTSAINAARMSTTPAPTFEEFKRQIVAAAKGNPEAQKIISADENSLRTAYAEHLARLAERVKNDPARVTRQTGQQAEDLAARAASEAQRATRQARAEDASLRRWSGVAINSWIKKVQSKLDPMDALSLELASKKGIQAYRKEYARLKGLTKAKFIEVDAEILNTGRKIEVAAETTDNQLAAVQNVVDSDGIIQARQQVNTAKEISDATDRSPEALEALRVSLANGEQMSDGARQAFYFAAYRQGWVNIDEIPEQFRRLLPETPEFRYVSGRGAQRSAQEYGEGLGRWPNVVNSHMVENIWAGIWDANAAAIRKIRGSIQGGSGIERFAANRRIFHEIIYPQLKEVEAFFEANKIYPVAGKSGLVATEASNEVTPIYLSQILDSLLQTEGGQNFIYTRLADLFGASVQRTVRTTKSGKVVQGRRYMASTKGEGAVGEGTVPISSLMNLTGFLSRMAATSDAADLLKLSGGYRTLAKNVADETMKNIAQFERTASGYIREGVYQDIAKGATRQAISKEAHDARVAELFSVLTDEQTVGRMFEHISRNVADSTAMLGAHIQTVSADSISRIMQIVRNTTGQSITTDKVDALLLPERIVKTIEGDPVVADIAAKQVREVLGEVTPEVDIRNAEIARQQSNLANKPATTANLARRDNLSEQKYTENFRAMMAEDGAKIEFPEDVTDLAMQTYIFKGIDWLSNRFIAHYGNATIHQAWQEYGSLSGIMSRVYMRDLARLDRASKELAVARGLTDVGGFKQVAKEAFDNARRGVPAEQIAPDIRELTDGFRELTDLIFSVNRAPGEPQSVLGVWFREGFDIDDINEKLAQSRFRLDDSIRLSSEREVVDELLTKAGQPRMRNGKPLTKTTKTPLTTHEIAQQWQAWDIDDPIDFLWKMERVTTELLTEVAVAKEASRIAKVHGLMSTKTRPGFIEVSRNSFGSRSIFKYLPKSDTGKTFIHRDLVSEFRRMDEFLYAAGNGNSGYRQWLRQNLDPILAMWKSGMTIWRPGHHPRNIIGDMSMSYLEHGTANPKYYARAVHMLQKKPGTEGAVFRGNYGVWDAAAAMQGLNRAAEQGAFTKELAEEILKLGKAGSVETNIVAKVKIGNETFDVSAGSVFRGLMNRGVLLDVKKYEDIIDVGAVGETITQRIAKGTHFQGSVGQKVLKKGHEFLANVSEGRDDFVRIADALHMMENGIDGKGRVWKSIDQMFDEVAAGVRRAHPDGSDLTPFEKNVMRRIIPFYSWNRKAIPLVLENVLTHPGRTMVYPKAMYNFGESMGVDLESLTEPFPEDQMFPDFVTDKMTGIGWEANGRYFSFDVGVASTDVLNMLFANGGSPGQSLASGLAGMLNPAIKLPIELQTGSQLNSGIKITDYSDYIDSNIPGFNYVNSILGISPSSIVENLGNGEVNIDQSRAVERGNRGGLTENPEYLINWLTGSKVLDTSKPNYITLARLQMIDKMRQERQSGN